MWPLQGSSNNRFLCGRAHQVAGGITELHVTVHSSWGRTRSGFFLRGSAPSPTYLTSQLRTGSGGFYSNNWGADPDPDRAMTTTRAKRRPHPTSSAGSGNHNTKHIPYQGDKGQHNLRKVLASIHTTNSPHTENIALTQSTQGSLPLSHKNRPSRPQ